MKMVALIFSIFILIGCNELFNQKSDLKFFKVSKKTYSKYINPKNERGEADLNKDKFLINRDYPIEISLYDDGTWYYNLDNLGDGNGKWTYSQGKLVLKASRTLFDMYIEVKSLNQDASDIVIQFSDRFGAKTLEMESRNFK